MLEDPLALLGFLACCSLRQMPSMLTLCAPREMCEEPSKLLKTLISTKRLISLILELSAGILPANLLVREFSVATNVRGFFCKVIYEVSLQRVRMNENFYFNCETQFLLF